MKIKLVKIVPFLVMAAFMTTGCTQDGAGTADSAKPAAAVKKKNVLKGKILGKSNKAKSISIKVGKGKKAKTVMVKFDDKTKGVKHAVKGHASIIKFEKRNGELYATVIKPKLAKLPKGVTELQPAQLKAVIAGSTPYVLVDARPGKRFHAGTIPTSISIPVGKMKKAMKAKSVAKLLGKDKNKLIITYCGGPT